MSSRYREVTVSSIVFGVVVGVLMNASITYAGLKIGFTIGGSAIAAVLGFGVLRGILRRGTILETNIAQTVASAVNIPNSGIIFTVPVLYLISKQGLSTAQFIQLSLACVAGAVLGAAFIIPLRKQMIDIDRLRFPTGTAVATILKAPGAGARKSVVLVIGAVVAALIYLPAALPAIRVDADLGRLDALVEEGKLSQDQARLTRRAAELLAAADLPADLVAQGEQIFIQQQLPAGEPIPAGLEGKVTDEDDKLALTAYLIQQGHRPREALRNFWAKTPLRGYGELGWRLNRREFADPAAAAAEATRVDRDGDGQSDLVLTDDTIDVGRLLHLPDYIELVFAIAPFALGAGYITGRPGLLVLAGGVLAYGVINPSAYLLGFMPETTLPHQAAGVGFSAFNRPLGIGMLLGGALMGVLVALPALRAAITSIASASRSGRGSDELGLGVIAAAAVLAVVTLYIAADLSGAEAAPGGWLAGANSHVRSGVVALVGAAWIWFAGIIIAQCTGMTDWSPISGMALLTVVLIMTLAGPDDVTGAVLIGAALCVAVTCAADMMQDLKTGQLLGAVPKRQQIVELAATGLGPVVSLITLLVIVKANEAAYGVALGPPTPTVAPQAQALRAVITGVQGGNMPYALYACGTALGVALGMGSFAGLGVLVGLSMYLPVMYILTYGIGCLANMLVSRVKGASWSEEWGVPFCAGLIVGEGILSLVINAVVLLKG